MLLTLLWLLPVLCARLSSASSDGGNSTSDGSSTSVTTLAVPTLGQTFVPTTTKASKTHPLGGLPLASATFTSIPFVAVDWANVTSDFPGPPAINIGTNVTFTNTTTVDTNVTFTNITTIVPRSTRIERRGNLPSQIDWRNRWGINWITTIQDQGQCESCWAFAATALMETMVRIQHGMWSKRSEADVHDGLGVSCATGGSAENAVAWAAGQGAGICDEVCDPYTFTDQDYNPCSDRSGRALRVPAANTFSATSSIQDQKAWIYNVGPLTASFDVYHDFDDWTPDKGVYKYDGTSKWRGRHVVLVVGYDDVRGCWIIKNSWGLGKGDNGFYYIGYGQVTIDSAPKTGMTNVNPDPWTRRRHHNGNMIQSGNGATHRNFELVRSDGNAGLKHDYRNGGTPDFSWNLASHLSYTDPDGRVYGNNVVGQPAMIATSFNRNYEIVYWESTGYLVHWYFSQIDKQWYCTGLQGNGQTAGYPGFIQTADSNFAVAVRNIDGSLYEWKRTNNNQYLSFQYLISNNILQSGPSLVQSNIGPQGNLYVVAVLTTGEMQLFWRDPSTTSGWQPGEVFGSGIGSTPPVMMQSYWHTTNETTPGSFQLCIAVNGQVQHWQRINKDLENGAQPSSGSQGEWQHAYTFGSNVKHVWSLIHGSFNQALEMVVENYNGEMVHWHYTSAGWQPTAFIP